MDSLNAWNDEIQRSLGHPIKRRIIECLLDANLSFVELLNASGESNHGKFGYHLRTLKTFVELDPSTKKYRLTARGRVLAGLIRNFRSAAAKSTELTRYVEGLRLGDHAFLLYDTEHFKRSLLFPFLKAGLTKGEAIIYLASEDKLDSEHRAIKRYGVNTDQLRKGAFTIMSTEEWYLERGKAQARTIMANTLTLAEVKQKATRDRAAFTGLRGAAEMDVFFDNAKINELLKYEKLLGRQLPLSLCALCLYDTNRLEKETFVEVYKNHGHIISKDITGETIV